MFIVPHNNPTRVGPWAWHATISYTNINTHFIFSLYSLLRPASVRTSSGLRPNKRVTVH